ncbi:DUF6510 family protein [Kibdelosporangium philippinense]|uniref:DUF6510 family protein n=1 Tax=Kibdelosporangium philippinense TaxID=211113 RepID=UPI0035589B9C
MAQPGSSRRVPNSSWLKDRTPTPSGLNERFGASGARCQTATASTTSRCRKCTSVLARLVRTPTDARLDLRGTQSVRVPLSAGAPR